MDIRGKGGQKIQDKWAQGPKTYMGMQTQGFPNMFMQVGLHAVFCNIPRCAEESVDSATDLISHLRDNKFSVVEPTAQAEEEWGQQVTALTEGAFSTRVGNWIMGDNVEGKSRAFLMYSGGAQKYREIWQEILSSNYKGFEFS